MLNRHLIFSFSFFILITTNLFSTNNYIMSSLVDLDNYSDIHTATILSDIDGYETQQYYSFPSNQSFNYFGTSHTGVWVTSSGYIYFGSEDDGG